MGRYYDTVKQADSIPTLVAPIVVAGGEYQRKSRRKSSRSSAYSDISQDTRTIAQSSSCGSSGYISYECLPISPLSSVASAEESRSPTYQKSVAGRRGKKRTKTQFPKEGQDGKQYQCTWCYQGFSRKDPWIRHQETEHCGQKEYICMPNGPIERDITGSGYCVFCHVPHPTEEHLKKHLAIECSSKSKDERTFRRFDYLVQHVKSVHLKSTYDVCVNRNLLGHWEQQLHSADDGISCTCGFCGKTFEDWKSRNNHVAEHFEKGSDMRSWKQPARDAVPIIESVTIEEAAPSTSGSLKRTDKQQEAERRSGNSNYSLDPAKSLGESEHNKADNYFGRLATASTQTYQICCHHPDRKPDVQRLRRSLPTSPHLTRPCPCRRCRDSALKSRPSRSSATSKPPVITYDNVVPTAPDQ